MHCLTLSATVCGWREDPSSGGRGLTYFLYECEYEQVQVLRFVVSVN